jgi:hypothetical protein
VIPDDLSTSDGVIKELHTQCNLELRSTKMEHRWHSLPERL